MKPVEPKQAVNDGERLIQIAENQPEYSTLPAFIDTDGLVRTEWEPSQGERHAITNGANVLLRIHTFGRALLPLEMDVGSPPPSVIDQAIASLTPRQREALQQEFERGEREDEKPSEPIDFGPVETIRPRRPLLMKGFPPIVAILGSTRFIDVITEAAWEMEKAGAITLAPMLLPAGFAPDHAAEDAGVKELVDGVFLRKIELADAVVVINRGGYVGESTAREIAHAKPLRKPIRWLENIPTVEQGFLDDAAQPPVQSSFPVLDPESRLRINQAQDGRL